MTREEAIDLLDNLIGMVEDNHNSDYDMALKMAIKALDQESILEKIRTEIENIDLLAEYTRGDIKRTALAIIDKYRTESEDKE